ncbi:hypothetical protein ACFQ2M_36095 [Kitasatospora saccharophila]|uniref:hypothetical protein n=1 Tax=Kitasatospora saccharophila TaxID=407973 RepID=UPI003636B183
MISELTSAATSSSPTSRTRPRRCSGPGRHSRSATGPHPAAITSSSSGGSA